MARSFNSLTALQFGFLQFYADIPVAAEAGLRSAVTLLLKTVRDTTGTYQPARGPYSAWAPLAVATNINRAAQGYSPDEPELMTGEMRDSYEADVQYPDAGVGSDLDKAVYQEFGTAHHVARPVLGMAILECEKAAFAELEIAMWKAMKL